MRQDHIMRSAIPGQPTRFFPPPADKIEVALERLNALSHRLGRRSMEACTRPDPIRAGWYAPPADLAPYVVAPMGKLTTVINDITAWWRGCDAGRSISWEWGMLREYADGWYDVGWHPCAAYFGLSAEWRKLLDDALERWP